MSTRLTDRKSVNGAVKQLLTASNYLAESGIEKHLLDLVSLRASQINGCTFCLAMHVRDLREAGEREDRLAVLSAWRDAPWFTDRERAAMAWTEAVTTLENKEVPDAVFEQARAEFTEAELADLTLAVIVINGWNRLNIAFQNPPVPFAIELKETAPVH